MERVAIMTYNWITAEYNWITAEVEPFGVDVRWLCAVKRIGSEETAYAAISGRDLVVTDASRIEALKAERIEQAKRAILEHA
jgi:hypothetical protein